MAVATITYGGYGTSLGDVIHGEVTIVYNTHKAAGKIALLDGQAGGTYALSDAIDCSGYDILTFSCRSNASGGAFFAAIVPFGFDADTTISDIERIQSIQGTAGHTYNTAVVPGEAQPGGTAHGSGNDSYLAKSVGWVDLRTAPGLIVLGVKAASGVPANDATMKIGFELIKRRK